MGDGFVLGVEIAEHAGARAKSLLARQFERQAVDMRGNASYRLAAATGQEKLVCGMAEERVLFRIDQFQLFGAQLRDPVWFTRRKVATGIDEGRPPRLALDQFNHHICIGHSRNTFVQIALALSALADLCQGNADARSL